MLTIGCLICAVLFGCCCGYIFWYFYSERENSKIYEELQEEAEVSPTPVSSEETPPEQPADTEPEEEIPIDFAALQAVNPEIYAWIRIEGTNIDYPIVQSSTDDTYYLNRTDEGTE